MSMRGRSWPTDLTERLLALVPLKLSGGQIAKVLSEEFGIKLTRNAVIGRIERIRKRLDDPAIRLANSNQHGPAKPQRPQQRNGGAVVSALKSAEKRKAKPRMVSIMNGNMGNIVCCGSPKLIWDLDCMDCRWIVKDGNAHELLYCSNSIDQFSKSYCAAHASMAYGDARVRLAGKPAPVWSLKDRNWGWAA